MTRLNNGGSENHLHNGDSTPNSNAEDATKSAKEKRYSDMTLEDMYNTQYDFNDEDDDSDWEPFENHHVVEIVKWFCVNCTMVNLDDVDYCNVCGEHKKSGILKHGFFASPFSQEEGLPQNETEVAERQKGSCLQTIASDKSTAIGFDERMLLHEEVEMKSHPHPERPDRLRAIAASLSTAGIFPGRCHPILAREIKREELKMVHSLENIEAVELTSHILSSYFTPDTYANQYSARAARLAAGLCADLASAIYSGSAKNGFALVRPPGHHAGVKHSMGFCLHNNAAIAACAAQVAGAKKVLIVDWDVHHGNGTQEIFEKNKSVLYISLHRHEGGKFYPGTGAADEVGTMGAEGYCVNVPWSRGGVGDNDYVFAFQHAVLPIGYKILYLFIELQKVRKISGILIELSAPRSSSCLPLSVFCRCKKLVLPRLSLSLSLSLLILEHQIIMNIYTTGTWLQMVTTQIYNYTRKITFDCKNLVACNTKGPPTMITF